MKKILVLLVLFSFPLLAQDFPDPVGYVNDFADIIEDSSQSNLEQTLRTFEENTSIEIAVVTVSSLEGLTVEDYTIRLAESWGVGKSDKDNGVIFLVAPNERKTRIEVGYGLEPDLTDAKSRRIIERVILPEFRNGDMSSGTVAGAEAIIAGLGNTPFEQRAEERRLAEEERQQQLAKARAAFLRFVFTVILIIIALVPFLIIYLVYRKIQDLKRIQRNNEETLARFTNAMSRVKKKFENDGSLIISALREEFNNTEWMTSFSLAKDNLSELSDRTAQLDGLIKKKRSWRKAAEYSLAIGYLKNDLYEIERVFTSASGLLDDLRSKRENWPDQLNEFNDLFDDVEKLSNHSDSGDIAHDALQARKAIGKAIVMAKAESPTVNWAEVAVVAAAAIASIRKVYNTANENIAFAERARKEGPELLASFPEELDNAVSQMSKSYVSQTAKEFYTVAKERYKQAAKIASKKGSWVIIFIALQNAQSNLKLAIIQAKRDKPRPRPKRRSPSSSPSYSSSISVGGGWSSRGSSGGGFGGFGGGGFGGGGASGSW